MVVVANKKIFGGGPYSVAGSAQLRMVGKRKWPIAEISIQTAGVTARTKTGALQRQHVPPFMPPTFRDPYHPGGNSLCYMIQTAHLMGCDPIYCLGFTLESGTGYFFGLDNPVTKRRSFYSDPERALAWLRWYDSRWPGRARLWPGWSGPVYGVLEVASDDEVRRLLEGRPAVADRRGHEPEAQRVDVPQVERLRQPGPGERVRPDGRKRPPAARRR